MRMLKFFFFCLFFVFFSQPSWALSCVQFHGQQLINKYPIIFRGIESKTDAGEKIFQVIKSYKGGIRDGELVTFSKDGEAIIFEGKNVTPAEAPMVKVVFINDSGHSDQPCSPNFLLSSLNLYPENSWADIETLDALENLRAKSFKEKLIAYEELNSELPNVFRFYHRKAELLEENEEYEAAVDVYKIAIAKKYQLWIKSKYGEKGPGGDLGRYNHVLGNPLDIPKDAIIHNMAGGWIPILGYARVLYQLERYKEAKEALELVNAPAKSDDAKELYSDILDKIEDQ